MVSERCVNTSEIQVLDFLPWEPSGSVLKCAELSVCNSVVYLRPRSEEEGDRGETGPLSQQPKQVKGSH